MTNISQQIDDWNESIRVHIEAYGEYTDEADNGRKFTIYSEEYYPESNTTVPIWGFAGYWDDDHSVTYTAETPFEVYSDMMGEK